jgi:hypothetical protein
MSTIERNCKTCKKQFQARQADVNRGWALYCTKSCKAKSDQNIGHVISTKIRQKQAISKASSPKTSADSFDQYYEPAGWDEDGWVNDDSGCSPA